MVNLRENGKKENRYDRLIWEDVLYQPGELKAVAYKEGKKWAEQIMKTTGEAARIKMSPEKSVLKNDGYDLIYVRVDIQDKNGLTVPRSKNLLKFSVSGPVEIVATDNGDATSLKPFNTPEKEAYNGLCLVIVRALPGKTGDAVLKVDSSGLPAEQVNLKVISDTGN